MLTMFREDTPVEHLLSGQQEDICAWFMAGTGHLIVEAKAGSGKTWTILKAIEFAPESTILLAAFNKAIQEVLENKLTNPNAVAQTVHSVGFGAIREHWGHVRVAEGNDRAVSLAKDLCGWDYGKSEQFLVAKLLTKVRELLPLTTSTEDIIDLAVDFDCLPETWSKLTVSDLANLVLKGLELACTPTREIDYADMIFLPLRLGILHPVFDLVVVDEAQDMTVAQLEILRRVSRGRIVLVGDSFQSIYHFRGADSHSLSRLKQELNAHELRLNTTYRCPRVVVAEAQHLVPDYLAAPNAPEGVLSTIVGSEALLEKVRPGDFVLSRKNAPLMPLVLRLLRNGVPARMQGRDVGRGLLTLVKRLATNTAKTDIVEWLRRLRLWHTQQIERLTAMGKEEKCEGIIDKCEMLYAIASECRDVADLQSRLSALFADAARAPQVVCSSVHKAKGLEADHVFILKDTLYGKVPCECGHFHDWGPCKRCECRDMVRDAMKHQEEKNIAYVAITRAKQTLTWVEGVA